MATQVQKQTEQAVKTVQTVEGYATYASKGGKTQKWNTEKYERARADAKRIFEENKELYDALSKL